MNYLRDLIHRLRIGESERRIARDLRISRITVRRYRELAERQGLLKPGSPMPENSAISAALGEPSQLPRTASTVEPYAEVVQQLLDQQVEMVAIFQRLRDDHGFSGSYSSVRRYVHRLRPVEPRVVVRVHTAPGEEAQVDFGPVGRLYDPATDRLRPAYVFVATLSYSRHQYAELVFDQKVPPWIASRTMPTRSSFAGPATGSEATQRRVPITPQLCHLSNRRESLQNRQPDSESGLHQGDHGWLNAGGY